MRKSNIHLNQSTFRAQRQIEDIDESNSIEEDEQIVDNEDNHQMRDQSQIQIGSYAMAAQIHEVQQ